MIGSARTRRSRPDGDGEGGNGDRGALPLRGEGGDTGQTFILAWVKRKRKFWLKFRLPPHTPCMHPCASFTKGTSRETLSRMVHTTSVRYLSVLHKIKRLPRWPSGQGVELRHLPYPSLTPALDSLVVSHSVTGVSVSMAADKCRCYRTSLFLGVLHTVPRGGVASPDGGGSHAAAGGLVRSRGHR